jgi:hypothetical protein
VNDVAQRSDDASPDTSSASGGPPWVARVWAAGLVVFGFLPIANWIPGGHEAAWYGVSRSEWISGSAISVGIAVVLFVVLRRLDVWPGSAIRRGVEGAGRRPWLAGLLLGALALGLFGSVARYVLAGRPLLIDEIVQVMQARLFASGQLFAPADAFPEFFSALHVVDVAGRMFSQFPPGGPLMLVPGVIAGQEWLTGPVFGTVAVLAFWRLVRSTEDSGARAMGAALLFAAAPFTAFMAGSHMNHVPALAWLCLALWSLHRVTARLEREVWPALLCGLSFGMMAAIRPVDGAAFALPAGLWLLSRAVRGRTSWVSLVAAGAGVAVPVTAVLWFNGVTTSDPLLFGYELLWGPSHGLGFHDAPWGVSHTPSRGLELISLYFLRLQTYLFETPLPSLIPAAAALFLVRSLTAFDRYLLLSSALLVVGYFAYWHDGFFLGPRFFYLLLPALVLWTARLPGLLRTRFRQVWGADRLVLLAYAASAAIALGVSVPVRVRQYAGGLSSMRHDYTAPAARAGVQNGLILVRESWGAQLLARLWALGVPRSESEGIYRTVDSCVLEGALGRLESDGVRGSAALAALLPLTRDSLRLVSSELSPDKTERVLPGTTYSAMCGRRLLEDRGGYSFLAPLLARDPGSNVYARDLHARDTILLARYPDRPVYVLRAASSGVGAPLVLELLNVDSARAEWNSAVTRGPEPAIAR